MKKKKRPAAAPARAAATAEPSSETPAPAASPLPVTPANPRDVAIDRAIVVLALAIVFARSLAYPLIPSWEDTRFLIESPLVHPSVSTFWSIVSEPHFEAYHPVHLLSYWLDVPWFGPVGWAVRTTNLVLFAGAGMLMLAWLRELGVGRWPALVATLAFVLHPVQVEVVVWGTARKDVLAVLFSLAAWLAHVRADEMWGRRAWASRAFFLLACLAKTSAVCLPLAMFAVDLCTKRRSPRDAAIWQLPSLVVAIALAAGTLVIWSSHGMIHAPARGTTSIEHVLASITHAVATALWPASTSPFYPLVEDDPPSAAWLAAGPLALGALGALAYVHRNEAWGRWTGGGLAAFGALFLPVANIVPNLFQFADRYLSLPFVGFALVLAAALSKVGATNAVGDRPSRALAVLAAIVLVPLALRTAQYETAWSSDLRLWSHATSTQPRAFYAWVKLGEALRDQQRFDGATEAYVTAAEIEPSAVLPYAGLLMTMTLRDERDAHISPSRTEEITGHYMQHRDDADALRSDALEMIGQGYRSAALFVLSRSLDIAPVSDERLERAAQIQLTQDHEWLARFYVSRMSRRPIIPQVTRFFDEERERLGITDSPDGAEHTPLQVPIEPSP